MRKNLLIGLAGLASAGLAVAVGVLMSKERQLKLAVGWPYLWAAGRPSTPWTDGPDGVDCSGFAQMALVLLGIMKASASDKSAQGLAEVAAWQDDDKSPQLGDLAFYGTSTSNITHVAVLLSDGRVIEAGSNGVVIMAGPDYRADYLYLTARWPKELRP